MFQEVKNFYNKDQMIIDKNTSLNTFHEQVSIMFAFNGLFLRNRSSMYRFIWPALSIGLATVCVVIELMMFVHFMSMSDMSGATESLMYIIISAIVYFHYLSIFLARKKLYLILDMIREDFESIKSSNEEMKKQFYDNQLFIWKLFLLWVSFCVLCISVYGSLAVLELLYQRLFATLEEDTKRPLIFPVWLPYDDPYRTPNYEMFLTIEYIVLPMIFTSFCFYVSLLFHFLIHNMGQMDLIEYKLNRLIDPDVKAVQRNKVAMKNILQPRFKDIVQRHVLVYRFGDYVQDVFSIELSYQVLFSSLVICLLAYQIASDFDRGVFNIRFFLLFVGSIIQLWIPCYIGTKIKDKSLGLGDICYFSGWVEVNVSGILEKDIMLFIMRANRPVTLQAKGLSELSLETFNSIISAAYTYFNMLRQMGEEK